MKAIDGTLTCIGAGNMAEALLKGALERGVLQPDRVRVTDIDAGRLQTLSDALGIPGFSDNRAAVDGASQVLLAVKPQVMDDVLRDMADAVPAHCLVISIAAGLTTERIEGHFAEGQRVVRVMPNTPSLVGEGAAAVAPGRWATAGDLDLAERLLSAVGIATRVDESDIDAVTAVSGSGPAYVFLVIEALEAAADRIGMAPELAQPLIAQTLRGATALWEQSGEPAATLRARVTSKGGTTEAALKILESREVRDAIVAAVQAAHRRSGELSRPTSD